MGVRVTRSSVPSSIGTDTVETADIQDNAVTLAKMAGITRGSIIYGNASGDPAALAKGTNTYVLTSNGTDIAWAVPRSASATVVGASELATAAEINTSTDTARTMTPAAFSDSIYGITYVQVAVVAGNADIDGTLETDALTINGTAIVAQATASAVGGVELATAAEVTTSTDTARAVTPATLSDSIYGLKQIQVAVVAPGTDIAEGDGKAYVAIPPSLNGMDLVDVQTEVVTAGDGSTIDVDLQRVRKSGSGWASAVDMLSTNCTIEDGEVSSSTHSGTEFAINASNDDVATSDLIRIDVDGNGGDTTVAKGLIVTMGFRIP